MHMSMSQLPQYRYILTAAYLRVLVLHSPKRNTKEGNYATFLALYVTLFSWEQLPFPRLWLLIHPATCRFQFSIQSQTWPPMSDLPILGCSQNRSEMVVKRKRSDTVPLPKKDSITGCRVTRNFGMPPRLISLTQMTKR